MALRSGVYIVPTDQWYIERTVWLIAGVVVLIATALATFVHPLFVVFVAITGLFSVNVSLNGFCIVGNILLHLGFRPALGQDVGERKLYLMQTDAWYLERRIYIVVGTNLCIASVLTLVHSAWWLAFPWFVGVAMLTFAWTGFCIMANGLYWLGFEPRLKPQAGCAIATSPRFEAP